MKLFYNILKILAALIITVIVILFTASFILQDKVAGMILKSLNRDIQTKLEFSSAKLSFLREFPKASLDLKNVMVHSSPGFNSQSFEKTNTDTLLYAGSVIAKFDITDIFNGIYNIDRIAVRNGRLNLFTDAEGNVNYEVSKGKTNVSGENFTIDLEKINVANLSVTYNNLATKLIISGLIDNGKIKSKISGKEIDFTSGGNVEITYFRLYDFYIARPIAASFDVALNKSEKGIFFSNSTLTVGKNDFSLAGSISENDILDIAINGTNMSLSAIRACLPEKYLRHISPYNITGTINIRSKIKGPLNRTSNPSVELNFDLSGGHVSGINSLLNVSNLAFKGFFTNGPEKIPRTFSASINNLTWTIGKAVYSGSLSISNFNSPDGIIYLKGSLIPSEIKEFFGIKTISSATGTVDFSLRMQGRIPHMERITLPEILNLNPVADIDFKSFGICLKNRTFMIDSVNGNIIIADTVRANNLKLVYKGQKFALNGSFVNLVRWLEGEPVTLFASAGIRCGTVKPELLFQGLAAKDTTISVQRACLFPGALFLDLNFIIDTFEYKTFHAEKIYGTLSYKPHILNIKSIDLNTFDGTISGNGFIVRNSSKSFLGRGSFQIGKIDVKKAFDTFHNFGQNFIKAENLAGKLSGSLTMLIPADSLMNPIFKSITAEGNYALENGALVNFGPVEELSSFISVSELRDIHFDHLENDFFIRDNAFYMPRMDVKSSAANLSVTGRHDFNNNYEYHVRILLSEMLSRKIKKPKPNTNEFGAVRDDGLGHTSLLLKIENKNDKFKVSYDVKAAGSMIKNDIDSERKTLKTILNQEYGLFKNDTTVSHEQTESAPRVKVLWGDSDTTKSREEVPAEKKENPIRNLFRKK
ncbi:MAG: AsmA-like C-terminal region-containing protein [Bacteroidales bacterium]|jgi:hypothetical protein